MVAGGVTHWGSWWWQRAPEPGGIPTRSFSTVSILHNRCNQLHPMFGKSWFIAVRAYGPLEPWFDKTWRPSDVKLVE
jgi:hypothetical protein